MHVSPLSTETRCHSCGEAIWAGSSICSKCKEYQKPWRNEFKYWSSLVGLITLICSGLVFSTDLISRLWTKAFRADIALVNLSPFGKTIVWNTSGQPLHLRNVVISAARPRIELNWDIFQSLAANESKDLPLMQIANQTWTGAMRERYGEKPGPIATLGKKEFEEALRNMRVDKYIAHMMLPDSEDDHLFRRMLGENYRTFSCKVAVTYAILGSGSRSSVEFPCVGAFYQLPRS
jgi:hypothetical protein